MPLPSQQAASEIDTQVDELLKKWLAQQSVQIKAIVTLVSEEKARIAGKPLSELSDIQSLDLIYMMSSC